MKTKKKLVQVKIRYVTDKRKRQEQQQHTPSRCHNKSTLRNTDIYNKTVPVMNVCKVIPFSPHHYNSSEQNSANSHYEETVNEPGVPDDSIRYAHSFQSLLQPHLLLQHNALHHHRHRIDPGQHHEDGETAVQGEHKP